MSGDPFDQPDYRPGRRTTIIGQEIEELAVDIAAATIQQLGVDIESQSVGDLAVDLASQSVENVAVDVQSAEELDVDLTSQTLQELAVDIAAQSLGQLGVDIEAQSTGNIGVDVASQSVQELAVDLAAQSVQNLGVDIDAQSVGNLGIDIAKQTVDPITTSIETRRDRDIEVLEKTRTDIIGVNETEFVNFTPPQGRVYEVSYWGFDFDGQTGSGQCELNFGVNQVADGGAVEYGFFVDDDVVINQGLPAGGFAPQTVRPGDEVARLIAAQTLRSDSDNGLLFRFQNNSDVAVGTAREYEVVVDSIEVA